MTRCSLHNHTDFADGRDTAEAMAAAAFKLGCTSFGISEHAPQPFDPSGGIKEGYTQIYIDTMQKLREQYQERMQVWCGIEQELYAPMYDDVYDYVIGSVHYVFREGIYVPVDRSREEFIQAVDEVWHGDAIRFAEEFYRLTAELPQVFAYDIVGHFDLITKYNEDDCLFSTQDMRYRDAVMSALNELVKRDKIFEINSGAISRGYRKTPYPQPWIIRELHAREARIILSADAHAAENIFFGYEEMKELVYSCGYREVTVFKDGQWVQESI